MKKNAGLANIVWILLLSIILLVAGTCFQLYETSKRSQTYTEPSQVLEPNTFRKWRDINFPVVINDKYFKLLRSPSFLFSPLPPTTYVSENIANNPTRKGPITKIALSQTIQTKLGEKWCHILILDLAIDRFTLKV